MIQKLGNLIYAETKPFFKMNHGIPCRHVQFMHLEVGGLKEHKIKSVKVPPSRVMLSANAAEQQMIRFPDRPVWLEKAICAGLKRKKQLEMQEKQLDALEEKLGSGDRWIRMICCLILSPPVMLICFALFKS